jgi:hypothetical protein
MHAVLGDRRRYWGYVDDLMPLGCRIITAKSVATSSTRFRPNVDDRIRLEHLPKTTPMTRFPAASTTLALAAFGFPRRIARGRLRRIRGIARQLRAQRRILFLEHSDSRKRFF